MRVSYRVVLLVPAISRPRLPLAFFPAAPQTLHRVQASLAYGTATRRHWRVSSVCLVLSADVRASMTVISCRPHTGHNKRSQPIICRFHACFAGNLTRTHTRICSKGGRTFLDNVSPIKVAFTPWNDPQLQPRGPCT